MKARSPRRFGGSIFLKILAVFAGALVTIAAYFVATHILFGGEEARRAIQDTALNYARYVVQDIGDPPDTAAARGVADRIDVAVRILGPGLDWASADDLPSFGEARLPEYPGDSTTRAGIGRGLGFGAEITRGDYRYLVALVSGPMALGADDLIDALFVITVLIAVYLSTRRILRPIRVLSEGVDRMRRGDLNVEMQTRRSDELGRLIVSFNAMARSIRERIRARDQLLLDVSHEIRSPLTRMRVALEMMPDTKGKRSVMEDIEETEAMIAELLETERLDSRHGGIQKTRTDISALVRECVAAQEDRSPGIDVLGADAPVYANVDAERIRVVFKNILSNALKYSTPRGPRVRVVVDADGDEVLVSFHDHGVGIAEDDLSYVFEPFYRIDRSRSKDTGGYGLGLSLSKRIAEAHGGSIEMSSSPDQGTSVLVSLPTLSGGEGPATPSSAS
jgi:signal transduction histidine kinase